MIKNSSIFTNTINYIQGNQKNGLIYNNATVGDLISKDTDEDGVLDWEETLWGLDPTKKETTPGIPDISTVNKLKIDQGISTNTVNGNAQDVENLTETDKFARELFSTTAALNQAGTIDEATADKISSSLAEQIQNATPRKEFTLSEIKVIKDDSVKTIKSYNDTLESIHEKYPIKGNVLDVLQKFIVDENNVDVTALAGLDPIIKSMQNIINAIAKMNVPQSVVFLHLDFLNGMERVIENLNDLKLYEKDPIVALGAISQYDQNTELLESAVIILRDTINKKLGIK